MVGMRDVAKKAGVSVSSVSLVINGTGYVSDDMRSRVEAAGGQPAPRYGLYCSGSRQPNA